MKATADSNRLLEVKGLQKFFPIRKGFLQKVVGHVRAVDDVSFFIREGETFSLVGESGCGKTTTSRCILRAVHPTSGQILFRTAAGKVVDVATLPEDQLKPLRSEMQMIFQDPFSSLNPRMTLLDIVGEPLLVNGVTDREERTARVAELLKVVGMRPEYMRRFPHAFSGGQRQRIGIARALALRPRLVVADEPVSALDVSVQARILNLLLELQAEFGLTYLFVAHDLSVVKHISERVASHVRWTPCRDGAHPRYLLRTQAPLHRGAALGRAEAGCHGCVRSASFSRSSVADPANPPPGCYFPPLPVCRGRLPATDA